MRRGWHRLAAAPKWLLVVVIVLVAARAALPWALKSYINKTLDGIPGYYGDVADVDVALWRGAYEIEGVKLLKTNASVDEPFFESRSIEISIDWNAVFDRRLVTSITVLEPKLQFIERKQKGTSQTSVDSSWQDKVYKLLPFQINRFAVADGQVQYKDETRDPKVDITMSKLDLSALNISNTTGVNEKLPSDLVATATVLGSGLLRFRSKVDFLSEPLQADVNASLKGLDLKEINDFAKAYGDFDFEDGEFNVTVELAASEKRYKGYAKTLLKNVDLVDWEKERKEGDSIGHLLWEGLAGTITQIFKNQRKDQFAARIPISGSRDQVSIDSWSTIGSILRNAFVQALSPKLEDSVDYEDAQKAESKPAEK